MDFRDRREYAHVRDPPSGPSRRLDETLLKDLLDDPDPVAMYDSVKQQGGPERPFGQHGCSQERSTLSREESKAAPVPDLHLHSALKQLVAHPLVQLLVREDVSELARNVDGGDDARFWVKVRELDNVARLKQSVEELVLLLVPDLERVVRVVGRRDLAFGERRACKEHRHADVILGDRSVNGVGRGRRERVRGVDGRGRRRRRVLALVRACAEDHGDGAVPLADDVALHDLGRHPCCEKRSRVLAKGLDATLDGSSARQNCESRLGG